MSHFAELNDNNVVLQVLVCDNNMPNEGYNWLIETFGGKWIQTSYNANFRGKFAGIGDVYDEAKDRFEPPKPFNSWIWDEEFYGYLPPIPYPDDDNSYTWNEESLSWELND